MKPSYRQVLFVVGLTISSAVPASVTHASSNDDAGTASTIESAGLKTGEPFTKARSRIVRLGWKPVRMHRNDNYEYIGTEKKLSDRGFVEVDSCSVDAGVLCIFYYSKAAECLRLDTKGEQIKYMNVTRWTNECPEKP